MPCSAKNKVCADELRNALGAVKNRPVDEAVPILKSMFPGVPVMPRGTQQKRTKDTCTRSTAPDISIHWA
jgi:hypothetical protein